MTKPEAETESHFSFPHSGSHRLQKIMAGILVLLHIALIPSLYLAVQIGRPRYFGLGLYFVTGVILFDILLIATTINRHQNPTLPTSTIRMYLLDLRVIVLTLSVAVVILALVGRGVLFYLSISLIFLLILFRALDHKTTDHRFSTNLVLITSTSFTLIVAQVYTVAYYAGTSDTITHSAIVAHVAHNGTLAEFANTRYWGFLVFHTLSAMGVQLTSVDARTLIALLTAIIFQVALVAIVLAVRRWTGSVKLALTAGVLVGFNASFLEWASKAHYQSLSFVFFAITILAFTVQFRDKRAAILSTIVPVAWVATHHLSFAMALFLTSFPIALATILYLSGGRLWPPSIQYVIFIITFLVYWTLVTNEIIHPLTWLLYHSPAASVGLPSTQLFIQTYDSLAGLFRASLPVFLSYVHHAFWLAICMLGLQFFLRDRQLAIESRLVALLGFAIAAAFYFPNPLWMPLRGLATLLRWGIMTLPLLILIPAYGVSQIFNRIDIRSIRGIVAISLVFLLIFTSIGIGMTSPSLTNLAGYDRQDQEYLSQQDLNAVSFTRSYATLNQSIYGSSHTQAYAFLQEWEEDPDMKNRRYHPVRVSDPSGKVMIESGLTIFQVSAYRDNAIKVRMLVESEFYENPIFISAPITDEKVDWSPMSANLVYSNGATVVQHQSSID